MIFCSNTKRITLILLFIFAHNSHSFHLPVKKSINFDNMTNTRRISISQLYYSARDLISATFPSENRKSDDPIIDGTPSSVSSSLALVDSKDITQTCPHFWRFVVLGICMLWATNFSVMKLVLSQPGIDPSLCTAVRFTIAAGVLFPRTIEAFSNKDLCMKGMSIGLCIFVAYFGQSMGLVTSTANKSAFLASMNVVWVAILSGIISKKFNLQVWTSVILAVTGAAFIELKGSAPAVAGDFWLLLQPVGFGTGYILLENVMKAYPDHVAQVSGLKLLAVALCCVSWAVLHGHSFSDLDAVINSPIAICGLLYTGVITSAGGVYIQSMAFKRVKAQDASIILSSEPLWAAVTSSLLIGEQLSFSDMFGGLCIISACLSNEFNVINHIVEGFERRKRLKEEISSPDADEEAKVAIEGTVIQKKI